jgi:hypothetical protein
MKICFCISGQLRGEMLALKKLSSEISTLYDHEVTIIFSLWNKKGNKVDGALNFAQMGRLFPTDIAKIIPPSYYGDNFWEKFPNTFNKLSKQQNENLQNDIKNLFPDAIVDMEDEILDLEFSSLKKDKNSIKMLYKRWKCNEIKKKVERASGKLFDLVVVTRPDLNIKINVKDNLEKELKKNVIFIPNGNIKNFTNDILAYGNSNVMDKYNLLFSKSISGDNWSYIHGELYFHLKSHNIETLGPKHIFNIGIETNNPITALELACDNNLIKDVFKKNIQGRENDIDFLIAFNTYLYLEEKENNINLAIKHLLLADITNLKIESYSRGRGKFIYDELMLFCNQSKIKTSSELVEKINFQSLSNFASKNLNLFFQNYDKK